RLIHEMLKTTAVQFEMDYSDQLSKGLELLEMKEFDVLILDLGLPDCQGLETLKKTRAKVSGIPIVVLTGLADEAIGIRAIQDGAQDYLVKGQIDGNLLVRTIRYSIERKRIEKELQKAHDELECRVKERTAELAILNDQLKAEIEIRKRAEEALQKSEEKYRTVADFAYDWEDWLDPYGKYIYVSPSCEWITGYRADEFVSDPDLLIRITHPDDRDLVEEHFREILSGSIAIHHIDFRIITRSGEVRWVSHYCQPVYSKDGNFLGRRTSNRDITNRKKDENELKQLTNDLERFNVELSTINDQLKAEIEIRLRTEKALKESEERYKRMVSAVTAYTYSVDLGYAGAISTQHSMGCFPVTGYNPENFEADPYLWYSMIYPDDKMMVENSVKEILAGHEVPPFEHRIIRRGGKVVWVRNTMAPYHDVDGRLIRYDGLIEDITERKRAEEEIQELNSELKQKVLELTEANKELDAFNHTVSHDLKLPLIIIGGFARRFLKGHGNNLDTKDQDMLNAIQEHTQKMERLIKDLLAFSHAGRQQIKPTEIDIGNLIATVLDELRTLSDGRMIKFDIKTLPPCYGDMALIKQVLINLLSNAIKFTRPKDMGVIEIGCRVEENENIYYVKDDGMGFNSQDSDKLFTVFQRLHSIEELEGSGVGLSIVQRIVNRHGGRVWAEGKINEGATFYFSLPKKDAGHS
ncbi:MAG: PAS domain-containing protein, partial [Nitrospirota bacterium]